MYETNTTDDGGIGRLRQLEATALVATVLAFGLTALLVPASAATEANGVAATLLDTLGWTGAGVLAVALEGAFFVGYERLDRAGYPRAALGGGAVIALVGIGDLAWNLRVLVELGLPETINAGRYGLAVAIVATAAVAVYLRGELRVAADILVDASREVTSRLSGVGRHKLAVGGIALLVALSSIGGVAGPLSSADIAAADKKVIDGFETGDLSNVDYGGTGYSTTQTRAIEGSYSLEVDSTGNSIGWSPDDTTASSYSVWVYPDQLGTSAQQFELYDSGGDTKSAFIDIDDGNVGYTDSNNNGADTGVDVSADSWYKLRLANIDYSANTYDIEVYDSSGTLMGAARNIGFVNNPNSVGKLEISSYAKSYYDAVAQDGASVLGVEVSGTVTDSDGNDIGGATITLEQSGSVVKSTTTASDGSYSFSGVGDGDYTIRAARSGYQNKTKSITVSGSPVTADLTMSGQLQGIVRDGDGNPITDANVTTGGTSTTTNGSGGYDLALTDGSYTVEASADGYQTQSQDVTVSGATSLGFSLSESGTFEREFQLGPSARQTYPPSLSTLHLYRFDRAVDFPLPGGTTFEAGPGTWTKVESTRFNSEGAAYARLQNGEPYRVDVVATSGPRSTRWGSLGWRANASRPDPYGITVGSGDGATPTETSSSTSTTPTTTPTGGGGPTVDYPDLEPPSDPFDLDDDDDYYDEPDGSGGNVTAPSGGDGFGPRLAGECLMADGTSGVLVEFWDPDYQTTELEYNLSAGNNSYAGARTFDTPAGYATWCVADGLTNNASDSTTDLTGNVTQNGTTTNFSDTLDQSAVFGGPIGGGGGGGEPSTGQQVVGIGLSAGAAYLLVRRFTEFRLTEALSSVASRLPIGGGGS